MRTHIKVILMVMGVVVLGLAVFIGVINSGDGKDTSEGNKEDIVVEGVLESGEGKTDHKEEEVIEDEEVLEDVDEDEESFEEEVKELRVDKVYKDAMEQNRFEEGDLIEYGGELFLEEGLVKYMSGYGVSYDDLNENSRIFKDEVSEYDSKYEEEGGAFLKVGQFEADIPSGHFSPKEEDEVKYGYVEYKDRLYISARVMERFMKKPLKYDKENLELDVGIRRDKLSIADVVSKEEGLEVVGGLSIQDEFFEDVVRTAGIGERLRVIEIDNNYENSKFDGFILNASEGADIEVEITDERGELLFARYGLGSGRSVSVSLDLTNVDKVYIELRNVELGVGKEAVVTLAGKVG